MRETKWRAANDGTGKRIWFLIRGEGQNAEYLWTRQSQGIERPHEERLVRFASYESAQRRADQLNAAEEAKRKDHPMSEFKQYRRSQIAEMADWAPGFDMTGVSVSDADRAAGSPKPGDKIARNPKNHGDRWLVAADYFAENFEEMER